jgi:hypothetical protein
LLRGSSYKKEIEEVCLRSSDGVEEDPEGGELDSKDSQVPDAHKDHTDG